MTLHAQHAITRPAPRIDLAGWSRRATQGNTQDFIRLFEEADTLGYDGVWFHEFRLLEDSGPYPSPLLLAAAVLARTQRLRVGTSALVLPIHEPQLLAEDLVQLHEQSQGRFDAGIGRGTDAQTLHALGITPDSTRKRFEQGCTILQAQAAQVPLYVAGTSEETVAFAMAQDLPLLLSLQPPEGAALAHARAWLQTRACNPLQRTAWTHASLSRYVCIAPTRAACHALLEPLWARLQRQRAYFAAKRGVAPADVPSIDPARALQEQFIYGTPQDCYAQICRLFAHTGMHHLRCVFNANGEVDNTQALAGMRLFAQEVLPALKGSDEILMYAQASRRSASAQAIVPASTYSSSLPAGTPRASRDTRKPRARSISAR